MGNECCAQNSAGSGRTTMERLVDFKGRSSVLGAGGAFRRSSMFPAAGGGGEGRRVSTHPYDPKDFRWENIELDRQRQICGSAFLAAHLFPTYHNPVTELLYQCYKWENRLVAILVSVVTHLFTVAASILLGSSHLPGIIPSYFVHVIMSAVLLGDGLALVLFSTDAKRIETMRLVHEVVMTLSLCARVILSSALTGYLVLISEHHQNEAWIEATMVTGNLVVMLPLDGFRPRMWMTAICCVFGAAAQNATWPDVVQRSGQIRSDLTISISILAWGVSITGALMAFSQEHRSRRHFEEMVFLRKALAPAIQAERESGTLLSHFTPAAFLEQAASGSFTGFKRPVTVSVSDIVTFTEWCSARSPQAVATMLNELYVLLDDLATAFGIDKVKTVGDAYWAVCNLPTVRPDHATRICHFALELQSAMTNEVLAHYNLKQRVGVATGEAVGGLVGTDQWRTFELLGSVNEAAKQLEQGCPVGAVLVTEATVQAATESVCVQHHGVIEGLPGVKTYVLKDIRPTNEVLVLSDLDDELAELGAEEDPSQQIWKHPTEEAVAEARKLADAEDAISVRSQTSSVRSHAKASRSVQSLTRALRQSMENHFKDYSTGLLAEFRSFRLGLDRSMIITVLAGLFLHNALCMLAMLFVYRSDGVVAALLLAVCLIFGAIQLLLGTWERSPYLHESFIVLLCALSLCAGHLLPHIATIGNFQIYDMMVIAAGHHSAWESKLVPMGVYTGVAVLHFLLWGLGISGVAATPANMLLEWIAAGIVVFGLVIQRRNNARVGFEAHYVAQRAVSIVREKTAALQGTLESMLPAHEIQPVLGWLEQGRPTDTPVAYNYPFVSVMFLQIYSKFSPSAGGALTPSNVAMMDKKQSPFVTVPLALESPAGEGEGAAREAPEGTAPTTSSGEESQPESPQSVTATLADLHRISQFLEIIAAFLRKESRGMVVDLVKIVGDVFLFGAPLDPAARHSYTTRVKGATQLLHLCFSIVRSLGPLSPKGERSTRISSALHCTAGIHCGPIIGAAIGLKGIAFDIFGDVVNCASRVMTTATSDGVYGSKDFVQLLYPFMSHSNFSNSVLPSFLAQDSGAGQSAPQPEEFPSETVQKYLGQVTVFDSARRRMKGKTELMEVCRLGHSVLFADVEEAVTLAVPSTDPAGKEDDDGAESGPLSPPPPLPLASETTRLGIEDWDC